MVGLVEEKYLRIEFGAEAVILRYRAVEGVTKAVSLHMFEPPSSVLCAVGLQVLSASSSGDNGESCQLDLQLGTSMATPVR